MKVTVVSRSGRGIIKGGVELKASATVRDLQDAIHHRTIKYYPSRQRLTLPLPPGSQGKPTVLDPENKFSHATSTLPNVFRNCFYYWTFGTDIAYYVNHPLYTPVSDLQTKTSFGFGMVCQLANFYCHILLRNLRSSDCNGGYQIPHGFLFNIVTCANYTREIYQWLGFNIAKQTVAGYVFLVVAASIMSNWALAKHRRVKKLFDEKDGRAKYPSRWVILPPFL